MGRCACLSPPPITGSNPDIQRPLQPPAVRAALFMGWPDCPVFAHKSPALGLGHTGRRSSAFLRPAAGRTIGRPLSFSGSVSVNRALLTARAALTPEEFQKWNNVRLAWASQAAARSGAPEACDLGCLCSRLFGWHFNGNLGGVGGWWAERKERK